MLLLFFLKQVRNLILSISNSQWHLIYSCNFFHIYIKSKIYCKYDHEDDDLIEWNETSKQMLHEFDTTGKLLVATQKYAKLRRFDYIVLSSFIIIIRNSNKSHLWCAQYRHQNSTNLFILIMVLFFICLQFK